MVEIYNDLTSNALGTATLPTPIPAAIQSFEAMPEDFSGLALCKLHEVFNYLRKCKHLTIPEQWKRLVPKADSLIS